MFESRKPSTGGMMLSLLVVLGAVQTVSASWWHLGVLGTSSSISRDTRQIPSTSEEVAAKCLNSPYLDPRQRELCAQEKKLLSVISAGASLGIEECQHQFMGRRWNCSTSNSSSVFGNVVNIKSRETAYIYAISSAGVTYSVTRACATGELEGCGCDVNVRSESTDGKFEWGGCSENVKYGATFAEKFVDSRELINKPDRTMSEQRLMNLWNNRAGRMITKKEIELVCKCHGVSGSCSVKICWRKMRPFRKIGAVLKARFDGASLVKLNKRKSKLRTVHKEMKRPTRKDLVYLHNSPDFCEPNMLKGSLGTKGRECKKNSYGLSGCNLMCCGRGYYTIVKEFVEDCDCKFFWCCRVVCKKCSKVKEIHYCN